VTEPAHPTTTGQDAPSRARTARRRDATVTTLVPSGAVEPVAAAAVQGALALDLRTTPETERRPEPRLAVVADAEVAEWAARFAQAVVEAAGGHRPLTQLVRWTSPAVYAELEQRLQLLSQATVLHRRRTVRPQVRTVHVCRPAAGSAEVSVHVRYGERSRAIAARLDHRGGRWLCTALVIG
jgi:hypothetical protein